MSCRAVRHRWRRNNSSFRVISVRTYRSLLSTPNAHIRRFPLPFVPKTADNSKRDPFMVGRFPFLSTLPGHFSPESNIKRSIDRATPRGNLLRPGLATEFSTWTVSLSFLTKVRDGGRGNLKENRKRLLSVTRTFERNSLERSERSTILVQRGRQSGGKVDRKIGRRRSPLIDDTHLRALPA